MRRVLIVGAGLTGCTLAHHLAREGVATTLLEREPVPGGLIRSEHMDGVLYEPILLSDIERQSRSEEILQQLEERRGVDSEARASAANFEEWCLELMGPILYERFIRPYTEKQWGRPARELSAAWAPRRVSVRWDNDPYLFPDPFQGWPAGPNGYTDLIDGLLEDPAIELRTGVDVTLEDLERHASEARA